MRIITHQKSSRLHTKGVGPLSRTHERSSTSSNTDVQLLTMAVSLWQRHKDMSICRQDSIVQFLTRNISLEGSRDPNSPGLKNKEERVHSINLPELREFKLSMQRFQPTLRGKPHAGSSKQDDCNHIYTAKGNKKSNITRRSNGDNEVGRTVPPFPLRNPY